MGILPVRVKPCELVKALYPHTRALSLPRGKWVGYLVGQGRLGYLYV